MPLPIVSVIIPVYNRESFISETIETVLHQTFRNFELIIINDGSTDNSGAVIRQFNDPRILYMEQKNKGLAATWNVGLTKAKGQYVKLLDSDDLIAPTFLEDNLASLQSKPNVDIVYSNWYYINENGSIIGSYRLGQPYNMFYRLLLGNMFGVHEVLFKKETLESVGYFDTKIRVCEDWDLYIRLARANCTFTHLDKYLSYHRIHEGTYKKVVVDRFREVLDKTFSDTTLPPRYRVYQNLSEARHALFLIEDMIKWKWDDGIDSQISRFAKAMISIQTQDDVERSYSEWLIPTWPANIGIIQYFSKYHNRLKLLGVDSKFIQRLNQALILRGIRRQLRIIRNIFIKRSVTNQI